MDNNKNQAGGAPVVEDVVNTKMPPFGIKDKLGYMFGDFGNDFFFILVSSYLMLYYTNILGVSAATVGTLFLVARCVDAFTDIGMGRMPDTPQRIATDTSQKLAIRYGETVKKYMEGKDLDVDDLNLIPLVYAGWLRYLMGVDDEGKPFEPSADPLLASSQEYVKDIKLGQPEGAAEKVMPLLKNKDIFGLDLTTTPLADKTCGYFEEMLAGPGAVRATIHKYASKA